MATASRPRRTREIEYPTSDGKPMAETDQHRILMVKLIDTLKIYYSMQPQVYVTGNLLLFYEEGNKRRHVSPDVFVVRDAGNHLREYYLLWKEPRGPEVVIEVTSKTTRREDLGKKLDLYRDVLKVKEYFLFDPRGDYLKPRLQGHRLRGEEYVPIRLVDGRMQSQILGLQLEQVDETLRLRNPATALLLPTPAEAAEQHRVLAEQEKSRAEQEKSRADRAEAELERLRQQLANRTSRNGGA